MNSISVANLSKKFGQVTALDQVTFEVKTGSITGFLGPNGAGKSTAINVMLGFLNSNGGSVKISDRLVNVKSVETRGNLGFLSNNFQLDKNLTVSQELEYLGNLTGNYDPKLTKSIAQRLDLDLHAKIKTLSTGNYQKVGIVSALQSRPKLLILDEPTNGLDPLVQAEFNDLIREFNASGTTVFISSHILSEISELCDEFIFIKKGQIVAQMTRSEIDSQSGQILSVKPTKENRVKILNFLNENKVNYSVETGDLEQTFMDFYDHDLPANNKEDRHA